MAATSLLAALSLLTGCTPPRISPTRTGSGNLAEEERKIAGFDSLRCGSVVTVDVQVGPAQHVHVEGDDNLLHLIRTDVAGGTLHVRAEGSFESKRPMRVVVTMPRLRRLRTEGAAMCNVVSLRGNQVEIHCAEASQTRVHGTARRLDARVDNTASLRLMGLAAEEIDLELRDSAQAEAAGSTARLRARATGASQLKAFDLSARDVESEAMGSSRVEITARSTLVATATGTASIRYRGRPPKVEVSHDTPASVQPEP